MARVLTAATRVELVRALRERYASAPREAKTRILEEFATLSGYHRKSAIRLLNGTARLLDEQPGRRPRLYDQAARQALIVLWEAADRICGKRLKPLMPVLVAALERNGHLTLDARLRANLLAMSAATIDRLLTDVRAVSTRRRVRRTPTALRREIPIRTFADWHEPDIGFLEIDLVAHCGDVVGGRFVHTLTATDIASGWTECVPLAVRDASLIVEALEGIRATLPFRLAGLDVDNGSEFLNDTVVEYCRGQGLEFTRSRPYHKNDQAWVEQKNGSVVRRFVGYARLEGLAAVEALSRLYGATRLFVNAFQPSFKLKEKIRMGARITKRYHAPATPCARLLVAPTVAEPVKAHLRTLVERLDPLALLEQIRALQQHVARIAEGQPSYMPVAARDDLTDFLASLSTAWREGEVRPTHRTAAKPARHWRTRPDAFAEVWSELGAWLNVDPDLTALEMFERLQAAHPGRFRSGQLRTLQRQLKAWRATVARRLVFGVRAAA